MINLIFNGNIQSNADLNSDDVINVLDVFILVNQILNP